jgi:hypothetical protein
MGTSLRERHAVRAHPELAATSVWSGTHTLGPFLLSSGRHLPLEYILLELRLLFNLRNNNGSRSLAQPRPPRRRTRLSASRRAAVREGWVWLLAPNAARPAGRVLCLFRGKHDVHGATPLSPPRLIPEPPPPPTGPRT